MATIQVSTQFLEELKDTLERSYTELDKFLQNIPKDQDVPILQDIAGCIRSLVIILPYSTKEN